MIRVSKDSSFPILSSDTYFGAKTSHSSGLHPKISKVVGSVLLLYTRCYGFDRWAVSSLHKGSLNELLGFQSWTY